jgi:hypothetical protein
MEGHLLMRNQAEVYRPNLAIDNSPPSHGLPIASLDASRTVDASGSDMTSLEVTASEGRTLASEARHRPAITR